MALSYSQFISASSDSAWIERVKAGILQYCSNEPNVIAATPPSASDVTIAAQRDRQARRVVNNPDFWKTVYAPVVAMGFLAGNDLLPATVTDAAIYARIGAIFNQLLPSL